MDLVNKKNPSLSSLVEQYLDKDIMLLYDMNEYTTGCTEWCMCEMKRFELVTECKKELICFEPVRSDDLVECKQCGSNLAYNHSTNEMVCTSCGVAFNFINDSNWDYQDLKRYNCANIHRYTWYEHFAQSLNDFANIGTRNVPDDIMTYCRVLLGTGLHITSHQVYKTLQSNGYRSYYQYKYEIANTLRGKREFKLGRDEIELMRSIYIKNTREFMPFQEMYSLGRKSSRGKPRLYWPMRFILARLCEEINRQDLVKFIRPIACAKRLELYKLYWYKLRELVDSRTPIKSIYLAQHYQLKQSKRHH